MDTRRNYLLRKHKLTVMTGLSVMVAGVWLTVKRDGSTKQAWLEATGSNLLGDVGEAAISHSVSMLLLRAQRFLGPDWTIRGLTEVQPTLPPVIAPFDSGGIN